MDYSYLVAQIGDTVRIEAAGPLFQTFGIVIAQRDDTSTPSVTARICTVHCGSGSVIEVHADYLTVIL